MKKISVVAPFYNEIDTIEEFINQVNSVMSGFTDNWELLLIDDGSNDGGYDLINPLIRDNQNLRLVKLEKNFGQTAATQAGIDLADGDIIVTLDSDLQNDPNDIPMMVSHLIENDLNLVVGWRKERKDPFLSRKVPSFFANKLISFITGVKLHDYGCSLKVYRASCLKKVRLYGEMHRFIPTWLATQSNPNKIVEIPVNHKPRLAGRSKYGISRTFRVIIDLLSIYFFMRFLSKPGHFFGFLGLIFFLTGSLILTLLTYEKLVLGFSIGDRPLLLAGIMFFTVGVQLISFGVLGEILSRTYFASSKEKPYQIEE
tara:strand:- start:69 stop:1010 length:942 start_codon:yes stop_codon:yes gene_type:complete